VTARQSSLILMFIGGVTFAVFGIAGYGYVGIAGWCLAAVGAVWYTYDFLKGNWRRPK
jgi:hypothetical protein